MYARFTYLQVQACLAQVAAESQRAQANGALVGRQTLAAVSARIPAAAVLRAFLCAAYGGWRIGNDELVGRMLARRRCGTCNLLRARRNSNGRVRQSAVIANAVVSDEFMECVCEYNNNMFVNHKSGRVNMTEMAGGNLVRL